MASGNVSPISFAEAWHTVLIAGTVCPGVCKVGDWKRANEWDVKKGKGTVGATITYVSRPPAKGSIEFLAWTDDHFKQWETYIVLLKYDPTKKAVQAVDIFYPSLADIDITSVVTEDIGNWVHQGQSLYSRTVNFLEYSPPPAKSATSTPNTANAGNAGATPGAQPQAAPDANQVQIQQLLAQAQAP